MLYEHNHGYQSLFKETIQQQKTTLLLNIKLIPPWSLLENAVSPLCNFYKGRTCPKNIHTSFYKVLTLRCYKF